MSGTIGWSRYFLETAKQLVDATIGVDSGVGYDILLRRGVDTLPAQRVRIVVWRASSIVDAGGAQASRAMVQVIGDTTFDVQVGDRFNDTTNTLYRIVFVEAVQHLRIRAIAEMDQ